MQIKIKYWCTGKKLETCDVFYDGIKALKYYLKRFKPMKKAICYYNNSKKCVKLNKQTNSKIKKYKTHYVKGFYKNLKKTRKLMKSKFYKPEFYNTL